MKHFFLRCEQKCTGCTLLKTLSTGKIFPSNFVLPGWKAKSKQRLGMSGRSVRSVWLAVGTILCQLALKLTLHLFMRKSSFNPITLQRRIKKTYGTRMTVVFAPNMFNSRNADIIVHTDRSKRVSRFMTLYMRFVIKTHLNKLDPFRDGPPYMMESLAVVASVF